MMISRVVMTVLFVTALAVLGTVELFSRRDRARIPSLADVAGFVMEYRLGRLPVGRVAVYGFWLWVGWHFLAR